MKKNSKNIDKKFGSFSGNYKKLQRLTKKIGLQIDSKVFDKSSAHYAGDNVVRGDNDEVNPRSRDDSWFSNLCHEIGHWIVASPEERKIPNFNTGTSPAGGNNYIEKKYYDGHKKSGYTETWASAVGIAIDKWAGGDWEGHAKYHTWEDEQLDNALKYLKKIRVLKSNGAIRTPLTKLGSKRYKNLDKLAVQR